MCIEHLESYVSICLANSVVSTSPCHALARDIGSGSASSMWVQQHARRTQPAAARTRERHACTRNHDATNAPTRSQHNARQTHASASCRCALLQHMGSGGGRQVCPDARQPWKKEWGPVSARHSSGNIRARVQSNHHVIIRCFNKFGLSRRALWVAPSAFSTWPANAMQVRFACSVGRRSGISYQLSSASNFSLKDGARRRVAALLATKTV